MKAWEYVINTAMLGTDKPMPANAELPDEVAEITTIIDGVELLDKEAKFLQKALVIYNYRQSGFEPLRQSDLPVTTAQPEIKPYCSNAATSVLKDVFNEDNAALLELWLSKCNKSGQLFLPDFLPLLLDLAQKDVALRPLVIACGGNRALWLSQLNPAWQYFTIQPPEEVWQTGKPEERVEVLKKLRETDAQLAHEWLQQTWAQETAASKVDLLKALRFNVGTTDLEWLEGLLTEKGQKVKDEALALLKQIPGSSIVNQYQDLLRESVVLKKEKALLGMMTKVSIQQKLPATVDEHIFKSGIEKLAGPKSALTDEGYILHQLISAVPPSFWETQFEASPAQVVEYFEKYGNDKVSALGLAVSRFKQKEWVPYFLDQPGFYIDFLGLMEPAEQEKYLTRFLNSDAQNILYYAVRLNQEWQPNFALTVLRQMANYPYEYNRAFFNKHIKLIPAGIIPQLERIDTKDANLQNTWEKVREHLIKLLGLKQLVLKAFNA
ncbi:hypothetical protein BDD43_3259 [Mucilaginibacter gracilis]|uniref:Uncharacterized protein n=1 Tax=Mucilaginibacter gracilis TaxID=423350 RepID=A0A495J4Z7_9SPHI|nr:DUF5691 domain-containing protein [Mucilaginibacter gracilis]RKR83059.1 hypothetical protein BDD43_3259 [Mucilaginibacter gracilis]